MFVAQGSTLAQGAGVARRGRNRHRVAAAAAYGVRATSPSPETMKPAAFERFCVKEHLDLSEEA
eukprot:6195170-Pleurochrysis_carterae.AAC.9